jgi:nucleotide-binding universal stress UspA family protein
MIDVFMIDHSLSGKDFLPAPAVSSRCVGWSRFCNVSRRKRGEAVMPYPIWWNHEVRDACTSSLEGTATMADHTLTRRILVPLDGSEIATVAVPWLRTLASPESEIVLLRLIPWTLPMAGVPGASGIPIDDLQRPPLQIAAAYLKEVAKELEDISANVTRLAMAGLPADEILQTAEDRDVSLIIMATHGHGALGRALVGSVADRVSRSAKVPVLLVHPADGAVPAGAGANATVRRIVVPLDGSERSRTALPIAGELAHRTGASVHLLQAVPTAEEMFGGRDAVRVTAIAQRMVFAAPTVQLTDRERQYHEDYCSAAGDRLESAAARLRPNGVDTSTEVLLGPVVPSILSALGAEDMVVMTSHGEGGIRRWQIGSVAEKLIHQAAAPIVLVPDPERQAVN